MRITGPGPVRPAEVRRAPRSTDSRNETFTVERSGDEPSGVAMTSSTHALAPVDTLLVLQEVADGGDDRRRAVRRGHKLLDHLNDILHGLLVGAIPRHELRALADAARQERGRVGDPRLTRVLDEIELRAAVEVAKYEPRP